MCECCFNMWIFFSSVTMSALSTSKNLFLKQASKHDPFLSCCSLPPSPPLLFLFFRGDICSRWSEELSPYEHPSVGFKQSFVFPQPVYHWSSKIGANRLEWPEFWGHHWSSRQRYVMIMSSSWVLFRNSEMEIKALYVGGILKLNYLLRDGFIWSSKKRAWRVICYSSLF